MDDQESTPVKNTEVNETNGLSLREPLETPSTLREKKLATRRHVNHSFRGLRRLSRKALKRQSFVSSPLDDGVDIEPLQFGQRLVLRSRIRLPIKTFMNMHGIYKKDSTDATNMLRAARHPHFGWYPLDRVALRTEFEE